MNEKTAYTFKSFVNAKDYARELRACAEHDLTEAKRDFSVACAKAETMKELSYQIERDLVEVSVSKEPAHE